MEGGREGGREGGEGREGGGTVGLCGWMPRVSEGRWRWGFR